MSLVRRSIMTEISHHQLSDMLKTPSAFRDTAVFLIHGEKTVVEQCQSMLIDHLIAGASRQMCCETLDGTIEKIPDLLEQMNTYALLAGPKIVLFNNANFFEGGGGNQRLIDQILEACEEDNPAQAAKILTTLCSRLGLGLEGMAEIMQHPDLQPLQNGLGEDGLARLLAHCRTPSPSDVTDNPVELLNQAIRKGFPSNHYLLISAYAKVPKNRKFYKAVQAQGLVVDCHVPTGERRADKAAQESVLREIMQLTLEGTGKRLASGVFAKLTHLTGFDPATFRDNIIKLIDFTGPRKEISTQDVDALLSRTKVDPIFEMTNAVADRNTTSALSFLDTLIGANWHPLQIVAALANQMRKLLVAKDFVQSRHGGLWHSGISYPQFQNAILPAIQEYDRQMEISISAWQGPDAPSKNAGDRAGAKKAGTDLSLASNPGNLYPVYQNLLKSERYTQEELISAMVRLSEVDVRLKSTGQSAAVVLKTLVISLCGASRPKGR